MLLIKHARQLITLAGPKGPRAGSAMDDVSIIQDGAVLIEGDTIRAVGPTFEVENLGGVTRIIDGREKPFLVLPGFVDSHSHPIFAATREDEYDLRTRGATYLEIAHAGGGIRSSVRKVRAASKPQLVTNALPYAQQFLTFGTTTLEAKSGYGLTLADEIKMLEAIQELGHRLPLTLVPTFLGAHDVPDEYRDRRAAYVDLLVNEMLPEVARRKLAVFCDVFCDVGFFSVDEARQILLAAQAQGFRLKIHAEELGPSGGADLAAEVGAVSADHLEFLSDAGIANLRRAGVIATLLPGTAFNLGLKQYPPARRLIDGGVPVALATDFNPGTCFSPNLQLIITMACAQMKMTPAEAITAATINGACALGLGDTIGSLEVGKTADLILLNLTDYRQLPYYFGVNHCAQVIKHGKVLA
ncbi:MAG: imidazolonepropionase [Acidobacteria bacterium]|nr:imidazolonepropionase [Acidobacteriota bacterium]